MYIGLLKNSKTHCYTHILHNIRYNSMLKTMVHYILAIDCKWPKKKIRCEMVKNITIYLHTKTRYVFFEHNSIILYSVYVVLYKDTYVVCPKRTYVQRVVR